MRCNICNRIQRVGVFNGQTCQCGCGAIWESSLTLYESAMFRLGLWKRYDMSGIISVKAPLGGGRQAMTDALNKISETVKEP